MHVPVIAVRVRLGYNGSTMARAARKTKRPREYVVDEQGRRTAVVVPIEEYEELLEAAEQREDVRHLEKARNVPGDPFPWEQVKSELRKEGKLP